MYCDDENFREYMQANDNLKTFQLAKKLAEKVPNKETYRLRATILATMFDAKESEVKNFYTVNCISSAFYVLTRCLENIISFTETRRCTSPTCPNPLKQRDYTLLEVNANDDLQLLTTIDQRFQQGGKTSCAEKRLRRACCKGTTTFTYEIGRIFIIETSGGLGQKALRLQELPANLTVQGNEFALISVIAFIPPVHPEGIGHYVTYCRRKVTGSWELYDDLKAKVVHVKECVKVIPHGIIYVPNNLSEYATVFFTFPYLCFINIAYYTTASIGYSL